MILKKKIRKLITSNSHTKLVKAINWFIYNSWRFINNPGYTIENNGEEKILKVLSDVYGNKKFIALDVGANHGEWSTHLTQKFKKYSIHCFEPSKDTFNSLRKNINDENIHLNNFGLGNENSTLELQYCPEHDGASSLISVPKNKITRKQKVQIKKGDEYTSTHKIKQIDFIKIDVEGFEGEVIKGLRKTIEESTKIIQFEYGVVNIDSKFLLKDFYTLLEDKFLIGKLQPNGVYFKKYSWKHEDFIGPNFIAVKKTEKKLIKRLKV